MASYKFVAELYFEAESVDDALAKLGGHFLKLSRHEISPLHLDERSGSAIGEPEFDSHLDRAHVMTLPEESENV